MSWRLETVGGFCDFPTLAVSGQPKILGSGTKQSWGGGQKANVHSGPETWRTKTIGGQNVLAARNCWWILRFSNIGGFWPTKNPGLRNKTIVGRGPKGKRSFWARNLADENDWRPKCLGGQKLLVDSAIFQYWRFLANQNFRK